jgi:predicted ABC-type ATPase
MPTLTVFAGPNGSGKSTLFRLAKDSGIDFGDYFNADDIAAGLNGTPEERALEAQQLVRSLREEALKAGRSYAFETVMSHPSHLEHMRQARVAGFQVHLFFVGTEHPTLNVQRVKERVEKGGHDVPEDRIRERWHKTMDQLSDAVAASDHAELFDTSYEERGFWHFASVQNGLLCDPHGMLLMSSVHELPRWARYLPLLLTK